MTIAIPTLRLRLYCLLLTGAALAAVPVAVIAQDSSTEARLRRIEAEVRALQRKVFPGGDPSLFEPQIAPSTQAPANSGEASRVRPPATTPTSEILERLDALEAQLQRLTARSEEQANLIAQLERRIAALDPVEAAAAPAPASPPAPAPAPAPARVAAPAAAAQASTPPPSSRAAPAANPSPATAAATPSAARLAAVQAIAKPQTNDPGDDEYSYGFRLWNAGFYPEARQQLLRFIEQYPRHPRISYGRNLLGRAFLDDNMPEEAARWFLKNYQADKNGARAPDSLLYLALAMIALKDTKRACIALAEFAETYPLIASGRLASEYQAARAKVTCN